MLTVVSNKENSRIVSMPIEEMEKLGINDGDEIEFSKNMTYPFLCLISC